MSTEKRQHTIAVALGPVQVLASTWLGFVLLAILAYALTASAPSLGDASWRDAARLGTSVWALALGAPVDLPEATVSLIPLSCTLLVVWLVYRVLRSARIRGLEDVAAASASALLTAALLGFFSAPGTNRAMAAIGAAAIAAGAAACAMLRERRPEGTAWDAARATWDLLKPVVVAIVACALLLLVVALVAERRRIGAIYGYYVVGTSGAIMLTLAQLLYLPNVLVWVLAFATGSGFSVGAGTDFSAFGSQVLPLPAIPAFGALPAPGTTVPWLVPLIVAASLGFGIHRSGRHGARTALELVVASTCALFLAGLAAGFLACGSIGPGRMDTVGPRPLHLAAILALEVGGGIAVGLVARHAVARIGRSRTGDGAEGSGHRGGEFAPNGGEDIHDIGRNATHRTAPLKVSWPRWGQKHGESGDEPDSIGT